MTTIIIYSLPEITPKQRIKFNRELYGFQDYSNKGKYTYTRKGILQEQDYEKPSRGVIIVKTKEKKVINHLKKYGGKYKAYKLA